MIRKLAIAVTLAAATVAFAQDKKAPAPNAVGVAEGGRAVFVVDSVDQKTREVVLKDAAGKPFKFVAGPEVKNLPQVNKGDKVTFEALEALVIDLKKSASTTRERVETEAQETAPLGSKPAGKFARSVKIIASVEALDAKAGTVKLRGPQRTVELKVKNPAVLKDFKVGDFVEGVYVEAVSIKVEAGMASKPAPAAPAKK